MLEKVLIVLLLATIIRMFTNISFFLSLGSGILLLGEIGVVIGNATTTRNIGIYCLLLYLIKRQIYKIHRNRSIELITLLIAWNGFGLYILLYTKNQLEGNLAFYVLLIIMVSEIVQILMYLDERRQHAKHA